MGNEPNWIVEQRRRQEAERKARDKAQLDRVRRMEVRTSAERDFDRQMRENDFVQLLPDATKQPYPLKFWIKMYEGVFAPIANTARQKAQQMYNTGKRVFTEYRRDGVAEASTVMHGRRCHINVTARDVFTFEFASSANPIVLHNANQSVYVGRAYDYVTVGTNVRLEGKTVNFVPRINLLQREDYVLTNNTSSIGAFRQVQGITEPITHPFYENSYGRMLTPYILQESYDPGHSHVGPYYRCTSVRDSFYDGAATNAAAGVVDGRDYDYDLPFGVNYNAATSMSYAFFPKPLSDWPRASGIQSVTHKDYGTRKYGISIDATDQFVVFPLNRIGALVDITSTQNVPEMYVKRPTVTYPAWVWRGSGKAVDHYTTYGDIDALVVDIPQNSWKFNHLGTKACAVMHERLAYTNDTTFWSSDADAHTPWTSTKFNDFCRYMGCESLGPFTNPSLYGGNTRYFVAPGLVEATITITITGPNDEDFTATVDVVALRTPQTAAFPVALAGYTWHDIPDCNGRSVAKGDLIVLDLEYYTWPYVYGGTYVNALHERVLLLSCKNLTAGTELFSILNDGLNGATVEIVEWEPTTLSAMFRIAYTNFIPQTYPINYTGKTTFKGVQEFGLWPIVLGVSQGVLTPTTMPAEYKTRLESLAIMDGRSILEARDAPKFTAVPLNPAIDNWTGADINNYRAWWAYEWQSPAGAWYVYPVDPDYLYYGGSGVRYKQNAVSEPTLSAGGLQAKNDLDVWGAEHRVCMFCTAPKFGWHYYQKWMAMVIKLSSFSTFYVHPSGTYAFLNRNYVYDRNGLPHYHDGQRWRLTGQVDSLTVYDDTLVEHCIFDHVQLEFQVDKKVRGTRSTSFLELYNEAVKASKDATDDALKLKGDIREMTLNDLRATFTKEASPAPNITGGQILALKCTWDGKIGWLHELTINNACNVASFGWGQFYNINMEGLWFRNPDVTAVTGSDILVFGMLGHDSSVPDSYWHKTFYDPVVIMTR